MLDQARDVRRLAAARHVVEDVGVGAVEQEHHDVARTPGGGIERVGEHGAVLAGQVRAGGVGRAAQERERRSAPHRRDGPTAGRSRRGGHPLPASTSGARACTIPSEPCSPRWPPWSSQLCAAECRTQRSGAAGWSKSCAMWSCA